MVDDRSEGRSDLTGGWTPSMRVMFYVVCGIVFLAAVQASSRILSPLIFAVVLVFAVEPVQRHLIDRGLPAWLAYILTCLAVVVFAGGVIAILWLSIGSFTAALPGYAGSLQGQLDGLTNALMRLGLTSDDLASLSKLSAQAVIKGAGVVAGWIAGALGSGGVALLFAAFLLLEALSFPARLRATLGEPRTADSVMDFAKDVRRFVSITAVTNLVVAIGNVVLLAVMGVDFALLWGVLSFLFGFIPNIGFWLSLIGPALMALLQLGPGAAVVVIVAFLLINGGIQNVLMPKWMGEGLNLSPFVVIFSVFFWSWVLGPLGAILAVVLTMAVRLVLSLSPDTQKVAFLLGTGAIAPPAEKEA